MIFHQSKDLKADDIELDPLMPNPETKRPEPAVFSALVASEIPESRSFRLPDEGIDLEELERDLLTQALARAHNNQTKAADLLGITRHTLRYRLEKHDLLHG